MRKIQPPALVYDGQCAVGSLEALRHAIDPTDAIMFLAPPRSPRSELARDFLSPANLGARPCRRRASTAQLEDVPRGPHRGRHRLETERVTASEANAPETRLGLGHDGERPRGSSPRGRSSTCVSKTLRPRLTSGRIRGGMSLASQGAVALDAGAVARHLRRSGGRGRRGPLPLGRVGGHAVRHP